MRENRAWGPQPTLELWTLCELEPPSSRVQGLELREEVWGLEAGEVRWW